MGAADEGYKQGGFKFPNLRPDLLGRSPVGHAVRVGDVCHYPSYWEGVGRIPPQGGLQADREATLVSKVQSMGIPPAGVRNGRGGDSRGGDLILMQTKYCFTVYCGHAHYGTFSGGGAEAGVKGDQAVVGSVRSGCGGDSGGGLGGGTDGVGGGDGWDGD